MPPPPASSQRAAPPLPPSPAELFTPTGLWWLQGLGSAPASRHGPVLHAEPDVSAPSPAAEHAVRAPEQPARAGLRPAGGEESRKVEKEKGWRGLQPARLLLGREVRVVRLMHSFEK